MSARRTNRNGTSSIDTSSTAVPPRDCSPDDQTTPTGTDQRGPDEVGDVLPGGHVLTVAEDVDDAEHEVHEQQHLQPEHHVEEPALRRAVADDQHEQPHSAEQADGGDEPLELDYAHSWPSSFSSASSMVPS